LARPFQQRHQHKERLFLEIEDFAIFLEFAGTDVQLKFSEGNSLWEVIRVEHLLVDPVRRGVADSLAPGY
jgi:hypothetical protein